MKKLIVLSVLVIFTASCVTNPHPLSKLDPKTHGSAVEEWNPHGAGVEWWYATAVLTGESGDRYLCQFTIFHGFRLGMVEGYVLHLAVTDVRENKRYFFETASQAGADAWGNGKEIAVGKNEIAQLPAGDEVLVMVMAGTAPDFSFSLAARPKKPAAWHGDGGIIVMGHEDSVNERSFYYSYTAMDAEGELTLAGKKIPVRGSCWFDRQWGAFTETAWDWFSFRLSDGTEMMLFAFPSTGYTRGTLVAADGTCSIIPRFQYVKQDMMQYKQGDRTYPLGWRITLPDTRVILIKPLAADQGNPARMTPPYWEGICDAVAADGEPLGYCVVETTAGAQ